MEVLGMTLEWSHIISIIGSGIVAVWGYAHLHAKVSRNTEKIAEHDKGLNEVKHTLNNERMLTSQLTGQMNMILTTLGSLQEDVRALLYRSHSKD
jgi:uncharacterized coiled-coil protein SlyX